MAQEAHVRQSGLIARFLPSSGECRERGRARRSGGREHLRPWVEKYPANWPNAGQPVAFPLPRVRLMVLPEPGTVRFSSVVASSQWANLPMVYVPARLPPLTTLKPFWLFTVTVAGLMVSQLGPTGTGTPDTSSLVT